MNKTNEIYMYIKNGKLDMEQVMGDYTGYVWSIINNSYNLSSEDIEEIISDVFVTVWNNQYKLDINKKMSTYIFGITKNLIKKKFRSIKIESNLEDFEEQLVSKDKIEYEIEEKESNDKILSIITKMKKEDKEIFLSYYYYSRKIKEISIEMNITETKVKTKLHRIRKKIKKELEKGGYSLNG